MLFVFQILVGLFTFGLISFLIGYFYLDSKQVDKEGYIYLNRRDILFMILLFPVTICFCLVLKFTDILYIIRDNKVYKKFHNWWSKPVKKI